PSPRGDHQHPHPVSWGAAPEFRWPPPCDGGARAPPAARETLTPWRRGVKDGCRARRPPGRHLRLAGPAACRGEPYRTPAVTPLSPPGLPDSDDCAGTSIAVRFAYAAPCRTRTRA